MFVCVRFPVGEVVCAFVCGFWSDEALSVFV